MAAEKRGKRERQGLICLQPCEVRFAIDFIEPSLAPPSWLMIIESEFLAPKEACGF